MKTAQRFLALLKKKFSRDEKQLIEQLIFGPCLAIFTTLACFLPRNWIGLLEDYHLKNIRMGAIAILIWLTWYYGVMLQLIWARKERGNRWPSVCFVSLAYGASFFFTCLNFFFGRGVSPA